MRTNEERMQQIRWRTAELKKKEQRKRQRIFDGTLLVCSVFLIVVLGIYLPGVVGVSEKEQVLQSSGIASLVGKNDALSYILMGFLSFLLGVCVTVLLFRLRHSSTWRDNENP